MNDQKEICMDVTNLGRWGKCDVEFGVSKEIEVEYAMFLIQQYFDKHMDED